MEKRVPFLELRFCFWDVLHVDEESLSWVGRQLLHHSLPGMMHDTSRLHEWEGMFCPGGKCRPEIRLLMLSSGCLQTFPYPHGYRD